MNEFWPGISVSLEKQWPLFEALRTTASIIFAVIGVWLALIYPQALEKLMDGQATGDPAVSQRYAQLLKPLFYATATLAFILVYGLARQIFPQYPVFVKYSDTLRGLSFSMLTFLTLLQLWTLFLLLVPGEVLKDDLSKASARRELRDKLFSRVQKD
jgi:hypothetical protein